jgi:CRISPR-associated protein Cas2
VTARRLYLVTYDVADRRRWRRAFRLLTRTGHWAQYSAFFCRLAPARRDALEQSLRRILSEAEDRLLIVDLGPADSAQARIMSLGALHLPEPPRAVIL